MSASYAVSVVTVFFLLSRHWFPFVSLGHPSQWAHAVLCSCCVVRHNQQSGMSWKRSHEIICSALCTQNNTDLQLTVETLFVEGHLDLSFNCHRLNKCFWFCVICSFVVPSWHLGHGRFLTSLISRPVGLFICEKAWWIYENIFSFKAEFSSWVSPASSHLGHLNDCLKSDLYQSSVLSLTFFSPYLQASLQVCLSSLLHVCAVIFGLSLLPIFCCQNAWKFFFLPAAFCQTWLIDT